MKSYVCSACGEKQKVVNQWQTASVAYAFDLAEGYASNEMVDSIGGDHEDWACPNCGEEIRDKKLIEKIEAQLYPN
jgi:rubredoxin